MRCPKCHYLSFDPEPRCRNCGYDLAVADADLALHDPEPAADPLPDLTLRPPAAAPVTPFSLEIGRPVAAPPERTEPGPRLALVEEAAAAPPVDLRRPPVRAPHTTAELPLFVKDIGDQDEFPDEAGLGRPPVTIPPPARPLSVRRAAPVPPPAGPSAPAEPVLARSAVAPRRLGPLDRDLLEDLKRVEREEALRAREEARAAGLTVDEADGPVEPLRRAGAAAIDVLMLGGLATFVFWATLKVCAVNLTDLDTAALIPLVLFIAVMDVTYLLMFTAAGGQTIGKMLMGIRVIGDETQDAGGLSLGRAASRAGLTVVSVVVLGLGWLPALFGRGIALHDRVTHTRVVRA